MTLPNNDNPLTDEQRVAMERVRVAVENLNQVIIDNVPNVGAREAAIRQVTNAMYIANARISHPIG